MNKIHEAGLAQHANRKLHVAKMVELMRSRPDRNLKEQIRFLVATVMHRDAFLKLAGGGAGAAFERLLADRPQYVSLLTAPYVDARWSSSERVDRLIEHVSALRGRVGQYDFSVTRSLDLLDLAQFSIPNYHIVIDKPTWFCHEGLLTLNLFKDNFRFYSITFSFCHIDRDLGVIVGGIQGRRTDDILAQYREFTKIAHGLRPRDFLFEVLRSVARAENVKHIFGVPDRFRYHRHDYFRQDSSHELHLDYDEVWQDRGGILTTDGLYDIPLVSERPLSRVVAKKRSMYRRRHELLDKLQPKITSGLHTAVPTVFGRVD